MNWDDLKVFLAVVRQPKLDQVSTRLSMDATTISRRLRRLEASLGLTLFERTRRGHLLTPAGEALSKQVEAIDSLALDIISQSELTGAASGRVRLGVPEGVGTFVIAPALSKFGRDFPDIKVDLIALSGFVSVPKREADMSLLLKRPDAGRLKIRRLADYSLGLFGSTDYLERSAQIQSLCDLRKHALVGYVDDLIYADELRYFSEALPDHALGLCSTSISAQMQMLTNGAGVGILPRFMADTQPNLVHLLPDVFSIKRTFWLAVHEDVAVLERNRRLSNFLSETLGHLK